MKDLSSIQFYQLSKKRPKGEKKQGWVRRTHKDAAFEKKVKVIRMRADSINSKLVNY